jgi:hypothetical protein
MIVYGNILSVADENNLKNVKKLKKVVDKVGN